MIDAISNAPPKHAIAPTNNIFDKPSGNTKAIKPDQRVEGTTTKTVIENGKMILEEYDRHGRLIRKTPPGYLPLDEKV
jgi:hypothetical protein